MISGKPIIHKEDRDRLEGSDSIIIWARLLGWVYDSGNEVAEAKKFIRTVYTGGDR